MGGTTPKDQRYGLSFIESDEKPEQRTDRSDLQDLSQISMFLCSLTHCSNKQRPLHIPEAFKIDLYGFVEDIFVIFKNIFKCNVMI